MIEAEGEAAGSSKTGSTTQSVRWRKQAACFEVAFKGEPLQYFKQFFDMLVDLLGEQTNLYSAQTTGTSIVFDHNEMEMNIGMLVMLLS